MIFVLSGGTGLGAIQVGMLRALAEAGLKPDGLVGTSVGAFNASFLAHEYTLERIEALAGIWRGLRTRDIFPLLASIGRLALGRESLVSGEGLAALCDEHLPDQFSDLSIPTGVVAADALSGDAVVIDAGDLRLAVRASAAIPGVFPSVRHEGRLLADGGLAANVPIFQALDRGAASLVILDVGFPCRITRPPDGLLARLIHAITLMLHQQVRHVLPGLGRDRVVLYLPAPCPLSVLPHDFSQADELIRAGYHTARTFLMDLMVGGPGLYGGPTSSTAWKGECLDS